MNTDNYERIIWTKGESVRFPLTGINLDNEKLKEYVSVHFNEEKTKNIHKIIDSMTPLILELNSEIQSRGLAISYHIS